jgi:DUF1365 family protein
MPTPITLNSGIYEGIVTHTRLSPKRNRFSYRVYMAYIDLDEQERFFSLSKLWSNKGFNFAWFRRSDYLSPDIKSLDKAVRNCVEKATGERVNGPIRVLTNLRVFGFLMNPITCYYCFDKDEKLQYIVAEVTSTPWRERIPYVIPCAEDANIHEHLFDKKMHVSPFMPMDMQYAWRSNTPCKNIDINLQNREAGKLCFHATLALQKKAASPAVLNHILLAYPLITVKIGLAIYWQALVLFLKGIPLVKRIKKTQPPTTENPSQ